MNILEVILLCCIMGLLAEFWVTYRIEKAKTKIVDSLSLEMMNMIEDVYGEVINKLVEEKLLEIDDEGIIEGKDGNKSDFLIKNGFELENV